MAPLPVGSTAPDVDLSDQSGERFTLAAVRGRPVVLAFYCEDDTEGCTVENREFSELLPAFEKLGAALVTISPQDAASHRKFAEKYGFAHRLLADADLVATNAYGLWDKKKMWGNEFMGVVRATYVIDADGKVAAVLKASRIKGHAQKVLEAVETLVEG
jgi:peroxiredoxin Q/BCP